MSTTRRFTSADLDALPNDDGNRYEIIDGELHVSKQPHWRHQLVCSRLLATLRDWSEQHERGEAVTAPGVIFAEDDDVAPDLVWISPERARTALGPDGKLHAAPELVVEVLSPGAANEKRDRETKLRLYSRRGVDEYWIVDWKRRRVEVFRREGETLVFSEALAESDVLRTGLLPDFAYPLQAMFLETPEAPQK